LQSSKKKEILYVLVFVLFFR